MSQRTAEDEDADYSSTLDTFKEWFHVPALAAIVVLMAAIRLQPYESFLVDGDVLFSGNDAWYHLREVSYTVRHWPMTMPFDPWTNFPFGTSVGQFGTLYDQIIATVALVVGLGSPSQELVAKVLLVAPAVFGALTAIPAYYIGKRLGGRVGGLFSAFLLALLPGMFLQRTVAGVADHNGAEPLFQALAVLGLMVAFTVAEREKPVWELVEQRQADELRRPLLWATLAGIATALYMWMWPPGVLLVGVVGLFLVVKLTSDVVRGGSPEPVAMAGVVSMGTTGVLMLVPLQSLSFSPTEFSLIQPFVAFAVAAGSGFMAWLARTWESRDADPRLYPALVYGSIAVGLGALAVVLPDLFGQIQTNLLRTAGFSAGATTRTIGEAQPYLAPNILQAQGYTRVNRIISDYGFTLFTAVAAAVWMLAKPLVRTGETRNYGYVGGALALVGLLFLFPAVPAGIAGAVNVVPEIVGLVVVGAVVVGATLLVRYESEHLFVITWAAFITSAAFTQVRFHYYLAVVVVVLNGYLLGEVLEYLDLRSVDARLPDVEGYQVLVLLAVVLLITAPVLAVPLNVRNTGSSQPGQSRTAWQAADAVGPGAVTNWRGSLQWMQNNTPREGHFGGANNSDAMDYYGTYEQQDDFAYPDGAYGVQSWWDYGHWITTLGHRIPNANPFQEGATSAANYLLAPSEERALAVLRNRSADGEGERTRYTMVDWQMVEPTSKFGAPVTFYSGNASRDEFYTRVYAIQNQRIAGSFMLRHQRYYESTMVRLYEYHGSAMEPQPVVVDWQPTQMQTGSGQQITRPAVNVGGNSTVLRRFQSMQEARAYVRNDSSAQIGGVGPYPSERISALQHHRLVKVSNRSAAASRSFLQPLYTTAQVVGLNPNQLIQTRPAWVKTFERVPGATVRGSGAPPNATVTARVQMHSRTSNSSFYYVQRAQADENGEFNMTLPYSTTGYQNWGPEQGYTNVSVRAEGPYTFSTRPSLGRSDNGSLAAVSYGANNVSVPEGLVNGARNGTVTVTLEENRRQISGGNNSSPNNATAPNGTAPNGTATPSTGNATLANSTVEDQSGSLTPPTSALAGDASAAEPARRSRA